MVATCGIKVVGMTHKIMGMDLIMKGVVSIKY